MTLRAVLFLASIFLAIAPPTVLLAAERHVDDDVAASGDGTSWATAFKTIQEGINAASDGDTVIVAEGIYWENIEFDGDNITLRSTDRLNPDVVANTVIDGSGAGPVVIFDGIEDETCVLSGFKIRNGKPLSPLQARRVVGWYTRATIESNVISGNGMHGLCECGGTIQSNTICENNAAGLAFCRATIRNNTISGNSARWG